jgi:hypothetical protein
MSQRSVPSSRLGARRARQSRVRRVAARASHPQSHGVKNNNQAATPANIPGSAATRATFSSRQFITASSVAVLVLIASSILVVHASLTLNSSTVSSDGTLNLTGVGTSTIDVGSSTLQLQTTNDGPVIFGNGVTTVPNASGTNETLSGYLTVSGSSTLDSASFKSTSNNVWYADRFPGTTFDAKVNACIAAVESAGGGTCDARGLQTVAIPGQSMAANVVVGDGTHRVTLLLPAGVISRASGAQFIYDSFSSIIGQGRGGVNPTIGTFVTGNDTVAAFAPANEGASGHAVQDAYIGHLSINDTTGSNTSSTGLEVGGVTGTNSTDVQSSKFEDIGISYVDIGVSVQGPRGCTCYNHFSDLYVGGNSYGTYVAGGANSNIFAEGGTTSGAVGLYDHGNFNAYIKPDIENAATHGIELAGSRALVLMPYEEADGKDVIDSGAYWNMVVSTGDYRPTDNSGNSTNFAWGPTNTPQSLGISAPIPDNHIGAGNLRGLLFGAVSNVPSIAAGNGGETASLTNAPNRYPSPYAVDSNDYLGELALFFTGYAQSGIGNIGHAPLQVGRLWDSGGINSTGLVTINHINLSASTPTARLAAGTPTGSTTYGPYYVVCNDQSGGREISAASNVITNGPSALSGTNGIDVTFTPTDGCLRNWIVLRGDTSHRVGVAGEYGIALTTSTNATVTFVDTNDSPSAYTPPTRDTTGDLNVSGAFTEGCAGTATLSSGSATVSNSCITGSRPVICTDNTATSSVACTAVRSSGSLTLYGSGSDTVSWAQL